MPVHEQITAAWATARDILADAFHPDDYEIFRKEPVPDGSGGTNYEDALVEYGKCALIGSNRLGREGHTHR